MRSITNLIPVIILMLMACETPVPSFTGACVPVKMLRGICGTVVFEIQDPAYYHFGEVVGAEENVFLGMIECPLLRTSANGQDSTEQTLYVELDPENFAQDCARCFALVDYSGSKIYNVRIHERCNGKPKSDDNGL